MEDRDQEVKTGKTISATFAAVIVLALPSLLAAEPFSVKWQETPPITVQRGDLVMRRGRGMWTRFFIGMSTREKRFSHVGFVHSVSNGVTMLIHAEAEDSTGVGDVHLTPWPEFFKESSDCAIFRYDGETDHLQK